MSIFFLSYIFASQKGKGLEPGALQISRMKSFATIVEG